MHRVIVSVAESIHVYGMTKFVVMYRWWRINRRGRTWFINVGVRIFFSRVVAAERRNIIVRSRFGRRCTMRFMVANASVTAIFICIVTERSRSMVGTIRGGAIRHINFDGVIARCRFFVIIKMIGILMEKSVRGFRKGASHTVIKYFKKT